MIIDSLYRQDPPYRSGRAETVYWAELKGVKYFYSNGKWMLIDVPAGWDDTVTDSETLRILNEELNEYRKENKHA